MRRRSQRGKMNRLFGRALLRAVILVAALAALVAIVAGWWAYRWLDTPLEGLTTTRVFEVARGASLRSVANALHEAGVLDRPGLWVAWARLTDRATSIKAGEYALDPGLTPRTLLEHLSSGRVLLHSITFVEGTTFYDLRKVLAAHEAVDAQFTDRTPEEMMAALGAPGVHPEGQFFPDTYWFPRGTSDLEILRIARERMQRELQAAWDARDPDLPLATPYEALILASIIEKETALEAERPIVAGVFVERLRRGMRLQTDPTVIYGMLDRYDGNIRKADLLRDTPYNTYTRAGLPPTPIAMPGLGSLRAATRPQVTGALFFVATGEPDGRHYFSKTLAEHEAAVQRYLRKLRERRQ